MVSEYTNIQGASLNCYLSVPDAAGYVFIVRLEPGRFCHELSSIFQQSPVANGELCINICSC